MEEKANKQEVAVKVTFPVSPGGPYQENVSPEVTVGTVRLASMRHFAVQEDPTASYVLAHDGQEQSDASTIGQIAGHAAAAKFTLIKRVPQGS